MLDSFALWQHPGVSLKQNCGCPLFRRESLNTIPRKEKDSADDDARECQRRVGLAEADDNEGCSQKERGYIEPPPCAHSAFLGKG